MAEIINANTIIEGRRKLIENEIEDINKDLLNLTHEPWVMVSCKKVLHGTVINLLKEAGYKVEERNAYTDVVILCVSIPE